MTARWFGTVVVCAALVSAVFGCRSGKKGDEADAEPPIAAPDEDVKAFADGNNAFTIDLYKKLAEAEKGNVIVSPYSVRAALAMTYGGARGQTADEMRKALHFTLPDDKLHPACGALRQRLKGGKGSPYELNVANALWGQKGVAFRPEFLDLTRSYHASGFREADFTGNPEARGEINRWVEEKTRERVKDLLKPTDITPNVRLVLTNAIYFKGTWKHQFKKERTFQSDFETAPGVKVQAPIMRHLEIKLRAYEGEKWQLLELPYDGDRLSMLVLLPTQRCGLREVESRLTAAELESGLAQLKETKLDVYLPRFKFASRFELGRPLADMGMSLTFSGGDFSGITPDGSLQIKDVIHGGNIEVDEVGTVAAAATVVTMEVSAIPSFQADHPFLFLLRDTRSGCIIFIGRTSDPR